MPSLYDLQRIAEVEFSSIISSSETLGTKLRILLRDNSFVDVWLSQKLEGRFGFHWEGRHLGGKMYRYDNFPNNNWSGVSSYPYHFHDGEQDSVIATPFSQQVEEGFRDFLRFVAQHLNPPPG
jgi:hypothetical protein